MESMIPRAETGRCALERAFGPGPGAVRTAWAPYRLSPIGAHTDHQLGLTSGFTLDRGIRIVFRRRDDGLIKLRSRDFEGDASFRVEEIPPPRGDWGDYARGVALKLRARYGIANGVEGVVEGELKPGGISSSAALQVAVLLAMADTNELLVRRLDAMHLVVGSERDYAGVSVGLLDPAIILFGKPDALVVLDCAEGIPRTHRFARNMPPREWIIVDSGLPRDLRASPYNQRVQECRAAARALGDASECPALRHVSPEAFRRERPRLDPVLLRRAEHFFSEHKRVKLGMIALSTGDLLGLGQLITASGESLTHHFECGTPETRALLELLREAPGVVGASYAGGGFGGMLQCLTHPGTAASLEQTVLERYRSRWPEAGARASMQVVGMGAGAHVT
jgi:galactokinase/galacturonokinase